MLEFELREDYIELIKLLKVLQIAENGAMAKHWWKMEKWFVMANRKAGNGPKSEMAR